MTDGAGFEHITDLAVKIIRQADLTSLNADNSGFSIDARPVCSQALLCVQQIQQHTRPFV